MTRPLIILAVMSVVVGWGAWYIVPNPLTFFGLGEPFLERLLDYGEPYRALDPELLHRMHWTALAASVLILLTGVGLGLLYYAPPNQYYVPTRLSAARTAQRFGGVYRFLVKKWYFDELYWAVLVRPCLWLARLCRDIDFLIVDGLVNGAAWVTRLVDRFTGIFDIRAVDLLVNLTGWIVYEAGDRGRSIQTGRLRNYLMFLTAALVVLSAGAFAWINH